MTGPMTNNLTAKPPVYYGWYIVAAAFFIGMVVTGSRSAFGVFVIPLSEEFGWSRSTISLAAATARCAARGTTRFSDGGSCPITNA